MRKPRRLSAGLSLDAEDSRSLARADLSGFGAAYCCNMTAISSKGIGHGNTILKTPNMDRIAVKRRFTEICHYLFVREPAPL